MPRSSYYRRYHYRYDYRIQNYEDLGIIHYELNRMISTVGGIEILFELSTNQRLKMGGVYDRLSGLRITIAERSYRRKRDSLSEENGGG